MSLLDLRTSIAEALSSLDITTFTHIPGRMTLPGAFIAAGNPYIEQGQTFGERLVRYQVCLVVQTGDNLSETEALDRLIEDAQAALESAGWLVEEVQQPYVQDYNNASGLTTLFTVSAFETFN